MACKMLFFDYRDEEKPFFENYKNGNYDIKFYPQPLNSETIANLSPQELDETSVVSVFITSNVSKEVIDKFKNLRIISTRSSRYGHIDLNACMSNNIAVVNVEANKDKITEYVLQESLKGIMSVYCGDKNYRII